MSIEQTLQRDQTTWQPTASKKNLQLRAKILQQMRQFFADRNILEVETPLLCSSSTTNPHIYSFSAHSNGKTYYLQTSPEYCMKRLLAANYGAIYQICKAFREDEQGNRHNSEFTMLEWYRPGFDHYRLMDEMDELLQLVLATPPAIRVTYAELFLQYLNINPHTSDITALKQCAQKHGLSEFTDMTKDDWLNLLFTHLIEAKLGIKQPTFLIDFPASQAALAKVRQDEFAVAERFEVYVNGLELANGFHELTDAHEQEQRFKAENQRRLALNLPQIPIDYHLINALKHGMPACAGVALGVDRLMMLAAKTNSINDIISFTFENA